MFLLLIIFGCKANVSNKVVFPAPDGPIIAITCPELILPLIPFIISDSPCLCPDITDHSFELNILTVIESNDKVCCIIIIYYNLFLN